MGVPVRAFTHAIQRGANRSWARISASREGTSIEAFKEVVIAINAPSETKAAAPIGR